MCTLTQDAVKIQFSCAQLLSGRFITSDIRGDVSKTAFMLHAEKNNCFRPIRIQNFNEFILCITVEPLLSGTANYCNLNPQQADTLAFRVGVLDASADYFWTRTLNPPSWINRLVEVWNESKICLKKEGEVLLLVPNPLS